jgi:hypothetical protein
MSADRDHLGRGVAEEQIIDESDDHARLVAANRNRNNLSFKGWMRLSLWHYLVWATLLGAAFAIFKYLY